jgi:anti-anti-sigma regulatory factor
MRIVERRISLDECRTERFEAYGGPGFWDVLDPQVLASGGVTHVVVLDVHGVLDAQARELCTHIRRLVTAGERTVVVNLGRMTSYDDVGMGELVKAYIDVARGGAKMLLVNIPTWLLRTLQRLL